MFVGRTRRGRHRMHRILSPNVFSQRVTVRQELTGGCIYPDALPTIGFQIPGGTVPFLRTLIRAKSGGLSVYDAREKWDSALHFPFLRLPRVGRTFVHAGASVGIVGCEGPGCSPDSPEADRGCVLVAQECRLWRIRQDACRREAERWSSRTCRCTAAN